MAWKRAEHGRDYIEGPLPARAYIRRFARAEQRQDNGQRERERGPGTMRGELEKAGARTRESGPTTCEALALRGRRPQRPRARPTSRSTGRRRPAHRSPGSRRAAAMIPQPRPRRLAPTARPRRRRRTLRCLRRLAAAEGSGCPGDHHDRGHSTASSARWPGPTTRRPACGAAQTRQPPQLCQ